MLKNTVSLFITEKCNQKCDYCDIPTIKNPKEIDLEIFKQYIPFINEIPFKEVYLSGGEIGTLDIDSLDIIFQLLERKVIVYTNGLFFKKDYYNRYKDKISGIRYHILDNNEIESNIPIDTYFVYVITKKNIDNVENVVNLYKKYNINFVLYDDKRNNKNFIINDIDIQKLKNIEINIEKKMIQTIEKFYKLKNKIENIKCFTSVPQIDFVRGRVSQCCKCHTKSPYLQMSNDSIKNIIEIKQSKRWYACDSCFDYLTEGVYKTTFQLNLKGRKK